MWDYISNFSKIFWVKRNEECWIIWKVLDRGDDNPSVSIYVPFRSFPRVFCYNFGIFVYNLREIQLNYSRNSIREDKVFAVYQNDISALQWYSNWNTSFIPKHINNILLNSTYTLKTFNQWTILYCIISTNLHYIWAPFYEKLALLLGVPKCYFTDSGGHFTGHSKGTARNRRF